MSNPTYSASCETGETPAIGGLSWNKSLREITLTTRGNSESFALSLDSKGNLLVFGSDRYLTAEQLVEYFVRSLTGIRTVETEYQDIRTPRRAFSFGDV